VTTRLVIINGPTFYQENVPLIQATEGSWHQRPQGDHRAHLKEKSCCPE